MKLNQMILLVVLALMGFVPGMIAAQSPVSLTIIIDEDSLTVYVPAGDSVSLDGLNMVVADNLGKTAAYFLADYPLFRPLDWNRIPTPICIRLERANNKTPLPVGCQTINRLLIQPLAGGDVFWYDAAARQPRSMYIRQYAQPLDICSGIQGCLIIYQPPTFTPSPIPSATPLPTPTPIPTATPLPTPTTIPQRTILYQEDFEAGAADQWELDWGKRFNVIDDGTGNHVLESSGTGEMYIQSGFAWQNYGLRLRFYVADWGAGDTNFHIAARRQLNYGCARYAFYFNGNAQHLAFQASSAECRNLQTADTRQTITPQVWHTLSAELRETAIQWQLDDGPIYTAEDGTYAQGSLSLYTGAIGEIFFDDILVWSLDES
ncbi:MAG TPA: hypothetical protein VHO69_05855 [Phototrophicaceae bacterium]|nr:hypothetical protein [Phototrophicaceae bacterium]